MQLKVFSIRDAKAELFGKPWFAHTHGEAERTFSQAVHDKTEGNLYAQYPEDYDLYYVGTYDDQTGVVTSEPSPQHMLKAISVRKKEH